jgi:hypothetical protein
MQASELKKGATLYSVRVERDGTIELVRHTVTSLGRNTIDVTPAIQFRYLNRIPLDSPGLRELYGSEEEARKAAVRIGVRAMRDTSHRLIRLAEGIAQYRVLK